MEDLDFWRTCCERGITICCISKPFKEETSSWQVTKFPTFVDRRTWDSSYSFDSFDEVYQKVKRYFVDGIEIRPWWAESEIVW